MPSPQPERLRDFTNTAVVLAVAFAALAIIPFYMVDNLSRGRLASYSAFSVFLIAYATWKMRDRVWYILAMLGISTIHLLLIFSVPKHIIDGLFIVLFPLAALDVFGSIYFLNRLDQR